MIAHLLGALILVSILPLGIGSALTFVNGVDRCWRYFVYGFASEAFMVTLVGGLGLGIWLLTGQK